MKILKVIGISVLSVIVLLTIISFFLPKTFTVEKSIIINADQELIYNNVSRFPKWLEWSAWSYELDTSMEVVFTGDEGEPGSKYSWKGNIVGDGEMRLIKAEKPNYITYSLAFNKDEFLLNGKFTFTPVNGGVKVIWINSGELGSNPVSRWMGLFMGNMLGPDLETSLYNLKAKFEN